jgi:hypothetical protein
MKRLIVAILPLAFACRTTGGAEVRADQPPPLPPPLPTDLAAWGKAAACADHPYNKTLRSALTPAEEAAMVAYQGNGFVAMNGFLRNPTQPVSPDVRLKASTVLGAIAKQKAVPKTAPRLTLYRTFTFDKTPAVGSLFEAKGFLSTTFNDAYGNGELIFGFNPNDPTVPAKGNLAITMEILGGAHGFVMNSRGPTSLLPRECEVLLSHGAKFRVDSSVTKKVTHQGRSGPFTYEVTAQHWTIVNDGVAGAADLVASANPPEGVDGFALDEAPGSDLGKAAFEDMFQESTPAPTDWSEDQE